MRWKERERERDHRAGGGGRSTIDDHHLLSRLARRRRCPLAARSLSPFSLQKRETDRDCPIAGSQREAKESSHDEGRALFKPPFFPFPYLGVDRRLRRLFGVHRELAAVLLLEGPQPAPLVRLRSAGGREAGEDFLDLAHDDAGKREKGEKKRVRGRKKKGSVE